MARYEAKFALIGRWGTSIITDRVGFRKYFTNIRDKLRAEFTGSSVVVSDIGIWQGASSNTEGNAFVVKDGPDEWLFYMTLGNVTINQAFQYPNNSFINRFFRNSQGTDITTSNAVNPYGLIYNCRKGSFGMGFDDLESATYVGGDYSVTGISPYTHLEDFLPPNILKTSLPDYFSSADTSSSLAQMVYCDIHKAFLFVISDGALPMPSHVILAGQYLINSDSSDTDENFVGWFRLSWTGSSSGTRSTTVAQAYTVTGTRLDLDISSTFPSTIDNYILPDGTIDYKSVKVINETYSKGYLHTDLVRVIGAYNTPISYGNIFQGPTGPLVKYTAQLAFLFKEGASPMPSDIFYDER